MAEVRRRSEDIRGAERRPYLEKWLQLKAIHPNDAAVALAWYDAETSQGRQPTDRAVLEQAHGAYRAAVEGATSRDTQRPAIAMTHVHHAALTVVQWRQFWAALVGALAGGMLWDLARTLLAW